MLISPMIIDVEHLLCSVAICMERAVDLHHESPHPPCVNQVAKPRSLFGPQFPGTVSSYLICVHVGKGHRKKEFDLDLRVEKQPLLPRVKEKKLMEESRGAAKIQSPEAGQVIPPGEDVDTPFPFYPQQGR